LRCKLQICFAGSLAPLMFLQLKVQMIDLDDKLLL